MAEILVLKTISELSDKNTSSPKESHRQAPNGSNRTPSRFNSS